MDLHLIQNDLPKESRELLRSRACDEAEVDPGIVGMCLDWPAKIPSGYQIHTSPLTDSAITSFGTDVDSIVEEYFEVPSVLEALDRNEKFELVKPETVDLRTTFFLLENSEFSTSEAARGYNVLVSKRE